MRSRRTSSSLPPRRRQDRNCSASSDDRAEAFDLLGCHDWTDADLVDLHEFMTCEPSTGRADPGFRERLRGELWWSLVARGFRGGRTPEA